MLASCPLVDTGITTTSKACFAARSPQTGLVGESLISSHFTVAFKRTGWDGLVLTGACDQLSALVLDEETVSILPVPELAGKSARETEVAQLEAKLATDWTDVDVLAAHKRSRDALTALLERWELLFEQAQA